MSERAAPQPDLPYGRQWVDADDVAAVAAVLRGDWLTTGPAVEAFEAALAQATGAQSAAVLNSGTAALHAAYFAAGVGAGGEIVTSPLTFVATASAALHRGARPRFADVDRDTGNLDPAAAAAAVTSATQAIVPVDYAGHPADYPALHRAGVPVIADAAHSLGALQEGRAVGTLAPLTALSFHPVKAITTGEGGAVLTDSPDSADRVRRFRNHGIVRAPDRLREHPGPWHYEVTDLGLNYRLPDVLCALGRSQLRKLPAFLARRREIAAAYTRELAAVAGLELPVVQAGVQPAWHLYVIRVREAPRRRTLFEALRRKGLGVQVHYTPVYHHPLFADLGYRRGACPVAEDFAARALSLPIFPKMSADDVHRVVSTVAAACAEVL